MPVVRFCSLLASLLLLATGSLAQSRPAPGRATPDPAPDELKMRVTLPTAVGVISDYATRLFVKDAAPPRKRLGTSNPVVTITIPLPGTWLSRRGQRNHP